MRGIRAAMVATVLSAALAGVSPAQAAIVWEVDGSIAVGTGGCGFAPSCLAFVYPSYAGGPCNTAAAQADGVEISIVAVPDAAWGLSGRMAWEAEVEPRTLPVTVDFFGGTAGCNEAVGATQTLDGPAGSISVPEGARWMIVGTQQAVNFTWCLAITR